MCSGGHTGAITSHHIASCHITHAPCRAIDLGSGMGLGGLAFALLGADVVLSDMAPVLPLLRRNYENNLSPAALRGG